MKTEPSSQYDAFKALLSRVVSVPREEMNRRETKYKRQVAANPTKRGPKAKGKPTASPGPVA
jgi:hypothetical protein